MTEALHASTTRESRWWVSAMLGLAVTAIALVLPSGIVIGRTMTVVPLDTYWYYEVPMDVSTDFLPYLAARGLSEGLHWSWEASWFAVSAVALGTSVALMHAWASRRRTPTRVVLPALIAVIVAPTFWLAGSTPGTAGAAMLGAVILFLALDADSSKPWSYAAVASAAWVLATAMSVSNLLLWFPTAWCGVRATWRRAPWVTVFLVAPPILWFAVNMSRVAPHESSPPAFAEVARGLTYLVSPRFADAWWPSHDFRPEGPGYPPYLPDMLRKAAPYFLLLGGAWLGVLVATIPRAKPQGSGLDRVGWVLFAFLPTVWMTLGSGLLRDLPFVGLAPIALAGLSSAGLRWPAFPWMAVALSLLAHAQVRRMDPNEDWREVVASEATPLDVVYTARPDRAYLLRNRYHVGARYTSNGYCLCIEDPRPQETLESVDRDLYEGHRVLLDADFGGHWLRGDERDAVWKRAAFELPAADR